MLAFFNLLKCRAWAYSWVSSWTTLSAVYAHFWLDDNFRIVGLTFLVCCVVCAVASAAPAIGAKSAAPAAAEPVPQPSMEADRRAAKYGALPLDDYLERWGQKDFDSAPPPAPKRKPRLFYPPPEPPPCAQDAAANRRLAEIQELVEHCVSYPFGTPLRRVDGMGTGMYESRGTCSRTGKLRIREIGAPPNVCDELVEPRQVVRVITTAYVPAPSPVKYGPAGGVGSLNTYSDPRR